MTNTIKAIGAGILGGLVVLLLSGVFTGTSDDGIGGVYSITEQQFDGGIDITGSGDIEVDNTVVIDSSGNVDAPITSTTGTFSGAVTFSSSLSSGTATTSTTTVALGKVCQSFTTNNGTDLYGYYDSNGAWATSTTSCN